MTVRVMALKSGVTAEDHRFALAADMVPAGVLDARSGVLPAGGASTPADLQSVSALQALITPFQAFIDGTSASMQSGYRFTSDASVTLTFDAGDGANPRIDLVVAQVRDSAYDTSGTQTGTVEIVKGTPAGTPAAPAVPASSIPLWQVLVPANASGANAINFTTARTDRRFYTAARGGVFPVASDTERNAITSPYSGMAVWRTDSKQVQVYDGAAWQTFNPAPTGAVAPILITSSRSFASSEVTGARALRIMVWGAGGGSGGTAATASGQSAAGGGGGGASYSESVLTVASITFPVSVTVGTGGAGGAAGANSGSTGGASSFGTLVTANGGFGGGGGVASNQVGLINSGTSGGAAGTGQIALAGGDANLRYRVAASFAISGSGGPAAGRGGTYQAAKGFTTGGTAGNFPGGGAAGAMGGNAAAAQAGAAGANGLVIVERIY